MVSFHGIGNKVGKIYGVEQRCKINRYDPIFKVCIMAQPFLAIIGIQHTIISETMRIRGIGSVEYFQNARCVSCAAQPEIKPLVEIRLIVRTDIQLDIGGILD